MEQTLFINNSTYTYKLPIYLTSIGLHFEETHIERPNGYPYHQLIFTLKGRGEMQLDNQTSLTLGPNDLLILPAGISHSYRRISDSWITYWISYDGLAAPQITETLNLHHYSTRTLDDGQWFVRQLTPMYESARDYNDLNARQLSCSLYTLLMMIGQLESHRKSTITQSQSKVTQVIDYIEHHYHETLTIHELSRHINVSPQYLCSLFKKELNKRPIEYLNEVRINNSIDYLMNTHHKITEIAGLVGFMHPSYYGSLFRKQMGMSPSEFVATHKR